MDKEKVTSTLEEDNMENVNNTDSQEKEEFLADSVKVVSPGRLVAKRFFRSRLSMIGLITIILLFLFSFLGPVFYNQWGEIEMDMTIPEEKRETAPKKEHYYKFDSSLIFTNGRPSYDETTLTSDAEFIGYNKAGNRYGIYNTKYDTQLYFVVELGSDPVVYEANSDGTKKQYMYSEYTWDRKKYNEKGKIDANHWLGTDEGGYDVFVRLMYGGRISLTLGFVVVFLETFLGILFGGLAGYYGKWVDQLIMRIVDIFGCVPQFPILLIIGAMLQESENINQRYQIYFLMLVMTVLGWTGVARVVRGQILFLREQEYMVAAEALGLSTSRKIIRHLVPNIMPQLIVQMTLGLGGIILTESTLSYLGIGIPKPYAAWGTMISAAQKPDILQYYPNLWIPAGVLIVLAVLGFNFIGDGLRDAFDPKASR